MAPLTPEEERSVYRSVLEQVLENWTDPRINGDYDHGSICRYCCNDVKYPFSGVGDFHDDTCPVLIGHRLLNPE